MRDALMMALAVALGLAAAVVARLVLGPLVEPWNWVLPVLLFGGLAVFQVHRHRP